MVHQNVALPNDLSKSIRGVQLQCLGTFLHVLLAADLQVRVILTKTTFLGQTRSRK